MSFRARTAIVSCFAALGCGGGGGVAGPPPVASLSVTLELSALVVGGTTTATATPKDAGGNVLTGRAITWHSDNAQVATVSSTGGVTALTPGSANILATSEDHTGSAVVTVIVATVASVTVSLQSSTVGVGRTTQAAATTRDSNGNVITGRSVTWSSSNASVATVSALGKVTGVTAGSANITATSEGRSASAIVTVAPSLGYGSATEKIHILDIGTVFTPTVSGPSGTTTFVSRATSVATVDAQGTIHGVGEGQVWVAASAPGWVADSVYVIVPRNSTGPVLRTDLTTFNVSPDRTNYAINVILDTRSTPIGGGEMTVGYTTTPQIFTAGNYNPTGSPAPVVSNLQVGLLRLSLASGSPLSGPLTILQLSFTVTSTNASGFVTLTFIDLVAPDGTDLLPVSTSTRIPIIVHD
jgi:uncharacterized protein YjdB